MALYSWCCFNLMLFFAHLLMCSCAAYMLFYILNVPLCICLGGIVWCLKACHLIGIAYTFCVCVHSICCSKCSKSFWAKMLYEVYWNSGNNNRLNSETTRTNYMWRECTRRAHFTFSMECKKKSNGASEQTKWIQL